MSELANLIVSFYNIQNSLETPDEVRNANLQEIQNFESDANNLVSVFEVLGSSQPQNIKIWTSLMLRRMLTAFWPSFEDVNIRLRFRELTLATFNANPNSAFTKIFLYSIESILRTEVPDWPPIFEVISNYIAANTKESHMCAIEIIKAVSPHMAISEVDQNAEFIRNVYQTQIESGDVERIKLAAELLACYMQIDGLNLEPYQEPFMQLLGIYCSLDPKYIPVFKELSQSLENAVALDEPPFDPLNVLQVLIQLLSQEGIDYRLFKYIFYPIDRLICFNKIMLSDKVEELIRIVYQCASAVFLETNFNQNDNLTSIANTIENIYQINPVNFVPGLMEIISEPSNVPECIAGLAMLYYLQDSLGSETDRYLKDIISYCVARIDSENEYIIEASLIVLAESAKLLHESQDELANAIVEKTIRFLTSENIELIEPALNVLQSVFENVTFSTTYLPPIVESYNELIKADQSYVVAAINAFSDLVFTTRGEVTPYIEEFIEHAVSAAQTESPECFTAKGYAIELLTNIIYYNENQELLPVVFQEFANYIQTEDKSLRNSLLVCLQKIVRKQIPDLVQLAEVIHQFLNNIFGTDLFIMDEDMNFNMMPEDLNILSNTLILVRLIFKYFPALIPGYGHDDEESIKSIRILLNAVIVLTTLPFEDISRCAFSCIPRMMLYVENVLHDNLIPFHDNFVSVIQNEMRDTVASAFKAAAKLVKYGQGLTDELIQAFLAKGFTVFTNQRPFSGEGEEDMNDGADEDSMENDISIYEDVCGFFIALIRTSPQSFPVEGFINLAQNFDRLELRPEAQSLYVSVLIEIYNHIELQTVYAARVIEIMLSTIELCDFNVPPFPLKAATAVLMKTPDRITQEILGAVCEILARDFAGERYYWETCIAAVAFLCAVIRMNASFDDSILPKMMEKLPVKNDFQYAEMIYSTLVAYINDERMAICGPGWLRTLLLTLSYRDEIIRKMNLTEQTFNALRTRAAALLSTNQGFMEQVFENDEISLQRCVARLQ